MTVRAGRRGPSDPGFAAEMDRLAAERRERWLARTATGKVPDDPAYHANDGISGGIPPSTRHEHGSCLRAIRSDDSLTYMNAGRQRYLSPVVRDGELVFEHEGRSFTRWCTTSHTPVAVR